METISGRIPDDLYGWFAALPVEGAVTSSDKLRVLLGQLKRQYEGAHDYVSALAWLRDLTAPLRASLAVVDRDEGGHSEVVTLVLEHVSALGAAVLSARIDGAAEARALEDALVRRVAALSEALLRQAVTPQAAAFDPGVVRRHAGRAIALARAIPSEGGQSDG